MNIKVLEKILTSEEQYWVLRKDNGAHSKPGILMVVIPLTVTQGMKRDEIKLTDLEKLEETYLNGNIFLNEEHPPFQQCQQLYRVNEAFPIPCRHKEFLIKALQLNSDDIYDYNKLMNEL